MSVFSQVQLIGSTEKLEKQEGGESNGIDLREEGEYKLFKWTFYLNVG